MLSDNEHRLMLSLVTSRCYVYAARDGYDVLGNGYAVRGVSDRLLANRTGMHQILVRALMDGLAERGLAGIARKCGGGNIYWATGCGRSEEYKEHARRTYRADVAAQA